MLVKENQRREAHLHEIRIAAICIKHSVEREGCNGSLLTQDVSGMWVYTQERDVLVTC